MLGADNSQMQVRRAGRGPWPEPISVPAPRRCRRETHECPLRRPSYFVTPARRRRSAGRSEHPAAIRVTLAETSSPTQVVSMDAEEGLALGVRRSRVSLAVVHRRPMRPMSRAKGEPAMPDVGSTSPAPVVNLSIFLFLESVVCHSASRSASGSRAASLASRRSSSLSQISLRVGNAGIASHSCSTGT